MAGDNEKVVSRRAAMKRMGRTAATVLVAGGGSGAMFNAVRKGEQHDARVAEAERQGESPPEKPTTMGEDMANGAVAGVTVGAGAVFAVNAIGQGKLRAPRSDIREGDDMQQHHQMEYWDQIEKNQEEGKGR